MASFERNINSFHVVSPFWYSVTDATTIVVSDGANLELANRFIDLAQSRGVPVVPTLVDATPAGTMAAILADPAQRATHVQAIAAFAANGDFDGIDIDYEKFAFSDGRDTWRPPDPTGRRSSPSSAPGSPRTAANST